jgi:hypothetical protein
MVKQTLVHGGGRDPMIGKILTAAKTLLQARPDAREPNVPPFDAFWTRADWGFYAVKVIDCRTEPVDGMVAWAAGEARPSMLNASGWEQRLAAPGDPELILILVLNHLHDPDMVKPAFEAEIKKMTKPTRTRVWVTTEGWVATADPDSPGDVFLIHDT